MLFLLTSCSAGQQSETIIISGNEAEDIQHPGSSPVQVQKIYRLPDEYTGQWLGWSSSHSIIGLYKAASIPERLILTRLDPPFEQSDNIKELSTNNAQTILSPDGKYITEMYNTNLDVNIKILSLADGQETTVDTVNTKDKFLQDVSWSNNGKYLSYLVLDSSGSDRASLRLYNMESRTLQVYEFQDIDEGGTLLGMNVSEDGRSVLFESMHSGKTNVLLGRINNKTIEKRYVRQMGREQNPAWISNDQFVFLGTDGTLYEYDQRNSELSIILERVSIFEISQDKKFIAYSLRDEDVVYVGKMQGKNILFNEPVYHGIVPTTMYWNTDSSRLLIQNEKSYTHSEPGQVDFAAGPSFIIEFK
ncbi:hypothetical protein [Paenibacillus sp. FSL K6-1318]|uniref:hypothetical protein n=1 Tax=Paenibacillus sp. FSL K6-1318 TaxID=2975291 RepID=UPI0030EBF878